MRDACLIGASILISSQLVACSVPETADTNVSAITEREIDNAVQPEFVRAADPVLELTPSLSRLKVEQVKSDKVQGLLQGELLLDPFVGVKQPLTVTFTVTNPQSYAVPLRYNSGMTADLWLVTMEGKRLWAWSDDMMFTQALRDTQLDAGRTITEKFIIPENIYGHLE
ncbi:BsuPI-related putative proteinase inhibitor [Shewanella profunda]|uniref:BsuPI-related putative proteinase inhibitor n=1 Tax=Shewanella profunda TaxID=254793 RepID=UPI00200D6DF6|nr:BsuPI-related putative proteinase inhibitor [Shewanella profunda]MCL1091834.1 BsuPI-related putative proteinase inhibitor [Shewanella profunda]